MDNDPSELRHYAFQFLLLGAAFIYSLFSLGAAYKRRIFRIFGNTELKRRLSVFQVIGAFASFFLFQLFILPLIVIASALFSKGGFTGDWLQSLSPFALGWLNVAGMGCSFIALASFFCLQEREARMLIWDRGEEKDLSQEIKCLFFGIASWLIAYPIVFFIGQGIGLVLIFCFGMPELEQVAVTSLKTTENYPVLNVFMILMMGLFVPLTEELLFRGFFQTWLRGKIPLSLSIVVTALIFALFHYSHSQGISNIEYISALFVLSCFLGFIYERQRSLWAPMGLHLTFNTFSILLIYLS